MGRCSHAAKNAERSVPACCAASSTNCAVRHRRVPVTGRPVAQQREEALVADPGAQRVQHERAALVDPLVEHSRHPRVGEDEVGRLRRHVRVPLPRVRRGGAAAGRLRPEPFRVGREAFVEPDVAPVGDREAVAEPLVRQLVHDEPLVGAPPVEVVRPEDRHALRLDRVLQLVVGDDELVVGERVGPEEALQRRHDRGMPAEVTRGVLAQPGRQLRHLGHRAGGEHDLVVAPDLHADQV